MDVLEKLGKIGVVPVAVLDDAKNAAPLAKAMRDGGVPCAEVTFRTAAAPAAIEEMAKIDGMLVGAGTVLTLAQCKDAIAAGAKFIVSPGLNEEVVTYCLAEKVAVLPGCVTPTEIMRAMALGLKTVKFFPAGVYGGLKAMKALAAPFVGLTFVPTGGANGDNLAEYLAAPYVHAVGGSWLCDRKDVNAGDFGKIEALCRAAAETVKTVRG